MSIGTLLAYTIVSASVIILRYKPENLSETKQLDNVSTSSMQSDNFSSSTGLKPQFSWLSPFIGGCGRGEIISGSVLLFVCCTTVFSIHLRFSLSQIADGDWLSILILIFLIICSAGCLVVIGAHRQNSSSDTFRVPWIPLIPAMSILCNVGLMVNLNALTWVRFMVWMFFGLLVYFLYGIKNSKEAGWNNTYSMLIASQEAAKKPWGSLNERDIDVESKIEEANSEIEQSTGIKEDR